LAHWARGSAVAMLISLSTAWASLSTRECDLVLAVARDVVHLGRERIVREQGV